MADFGRILMGLLTGGISEGLISAFNRHSNSDSGSVDDFLNEIKKAVQSNSSDTGPSYLSKMTDNQGYSVSEGNGIADLIAGWTGSRLTTAEEQANAFNRSERIASQNFEHNEAVDARMWQQYVEENKYGWNTTSMQNAGLNPAMVYGGGNLVGTNATGATGGSSPATSVSPSHGSMGDVFNMLMSLIRMPKELKQLQSDIDLNKANAIKAEKEGNAALMTAGANVKNSESNAQNAESNARNATVNERQVTVNEAELEVKKAMSESNIKVNDEQVKNIAENTLYLEEQRKYISKNWEVAAKNANSQQKQALAALRQADAAVQNAATNDYLSTYQSGLIYAQELYQWAMQEGQEIVNKYLDPKQKQELENLKSQGLKLDAEGRLIDKQGHLVDAQTVKTYVNCATDIGNTISRYVGIGALNNATSTFGKSISNPNTHAPFISPDSGMLYNYNLSY